MKHVSTHRSSEVKATDIMEDDWLEIGGVLARVIAVSVENTYIYVVADMKFNKSSHHSTLRFFKREIIKIYNQTYPPTE